MEKISACPIRDTLKELGIPDNIIQQVLESTSDEAEAIEIALILTENQNKNSQIVPFASEKSAPEKPVPFEECKMVFVVRTDLGMSTGKIAAQVGHAGMLISSGILPTGTRQTHRVDQHLRKLQSSKSSIAD